MYSVKVFHCAADNSYIEKDTEEFDMTIELITGRTNTPLTTKTSPKTEIDSGKQASVKSADKNDSIAITAMAQEIKRAFESSSSVSAVNVDRVTAVKQALADGNYQINAEKIAEKMIQFEKQMPQGNGK
jgi:negative regulator of flagellin synthesis FlgM